MSNQKNCIDFGKLSLKPPNFQSKQTNSILYESWHLQLKFDRSVWSICVVSEMHCSLITMIGYGDIVPRTKWGKIGVIIYAIHGIPVYILYFTNIGKVQRYKLRGVFLWLWNVSGFNEPQVSWMPQTVLVGQLITFSLNKLHLAIFGLRWVLLASKSLHEVRGQKHHVHVSM